MYDDERDQTRKTYQLCRAAFVILALALAVACFTSFLELLGTFDPNVVQWVKRSPWYRWVDAPIVWLSLIGAALLWGRWPHASWQRRSGLLVAMSLVDLVNWFLDQADDAGLLHNVDFASDWFRQNLNMALGWGEFALLSSLACDYLAHLGIEHATDSDKSTRSLAATGAMVWMLLFCQTTNWRAGWPLQQRPVVGLEARLLVHGTLLIWAITLIQVTALVISAARESSQVVEEMEREDQALDPLRSRSDSHDVFDRVSADRGQGTPTV
jgi:hypothetical protein